MKRALLLISFLLAACPEVPPEPDGPAGTAGGGGGAGGEGGTIELAEVRSIGDSSVIAVDPGGTTVALAGPSVGGKRSLSLLQLDTGRHVPVSEQIGEAAVSFSHDGSELLVRTPGVRYERVEIFGARSGLSHHVIANVKPGSFRYLDGRLDKVWLDSSQRVTVRLHGAAEKILATVDSPLALHGSKLAYRASGLVTITDLDAAGLPLPTPLEHQLLAFAGDGTLLLSWREQPPARLSVLVLETREIREVERFSGFDVDPAGLHVAALVEEIGNPLLLVLEPSTNVVRTLPAAGAHALEFGPLGRHLVLSEQNQGELRFTAVDLETDAAHEIAALPACSGPARPQLDGGERHLVVWSDCGPGGSDLLRLDLTSGISERVDVAPQVELLEAADGSFVYLGADARLRRLAPDGQVATLAVGLVAPPFLGPGGENVVIGRDAEGEYEIVRLELATRRVLVLATPTEPPADLSVQGRVLTWRDAGATRVTRLP